MQICENYKKNDFKVVNNLKINYFIQVRVKNIFINGPILQKATVKFRLKFNHNKI